MMSSEWDVPPVFITLISVEGCAIVQCIHGLICPGSSKKDGGFCAHPPGNTTTQRRSLPAVRVIAMLGTVQKGQRSRP